MALVGPEQKEVRCTYILLDVDKLSIVSYVVKCFQCFIQCNSQFNASKFIHSGSISTSLQISEIKSYIYVKIELLRNLQISLSRRITKFMVIN